MTDVVERLLTGTGGGKHWMDLHEEAAGEIQQLRTRVVAALAALEMIYKTCGEECFEYLRMALEALAEDEQPFGPNV